MNFDKKKLSYLDKHLCLATEKFNEEIITDENKDYRRGFRAGVLFSFLQIKSDIGTIRYVTTEQQTD